MSLNDPFGNMRTGLEMEKGGKRLRMRRRPVRVFPYHLSKKCDDLSLYGSKQKKEK
jgi:hypothetical protein